MSTHGNEIRPAFLYNFSITDPGESSLV